MSSPPAGDGPLDLLIRALCTYDTHPVIVSPFTILSIFSVVVYYSGSDSRALRVDCMYSILFWALPRVCPDTHVNAGFYLVLHPEP